MAYKRLEKICSFINDNDKVLDVGSDHCLVPIILKTKHNVETVCTDISQKCVDTCKVNLKKAKLSHVKAFVSDGLEKIDAPNYFTAIIIAGMGGKNISEIIKSKKFKRPTLILHPTNNPHLVRKALSSKGYSITDEVIIEENKVLNLIIVAKRNLFNSHLSKYNCFVGPVLKKKNDKEVISYYSKDLAKYEFDYNKGKRKADQKRINYLKKVLKNGIK